MPAMPSDRQRVHDVVTGELLHLRRDHGTRSDDGIVLCGAELAEQTDGQHTARPEHPARHQVRQDQHQDQSDAGEQAELKPAQHHPPVALLRQLQVQVGLVRGRRLGPRGSPLGIGHVAAGRCEQEQQPARGTHGEPQRVQRRPGHVIAGLVAVVPAHPGRGLLGLGERAEVRRDDRLAVLCPQPVQPGRAVGGARVHGRRVLHRLVDQLGVDYLGRGGLRGTAAGREGDHVAGLVAAELIGSGHRVCTSW